jgi:hypothetical protein
MLSTHSDFHGAPMANILTPRESLHSIRKSGNIGHRLAQDESVDVL